MRRRSQARLEDTRKRYSTILAAAEPAQWEYDALNLGLQDLAVFMGHDLNSSSLAAISEEVQMLADQYVELDKRFVEVMSTAGEYVQSAALPGQFEGPAPEEPVEKIGG